MPEQAPYRYSELTDMLDETLEVEFSFLKTDQIVEVLQSLPWARQNLILQWIQRVASTNIQLAYEFASRAEPALEQLTPELIGSWCLFAMDTYDRSGLLPAMKVIKDLDGFCTLGYRREIAAVFDDVQPVLLPFVQGLSGRRLALEQDDKPWTDGEVIYIPELFAPLESAEDNFQSCKAMVVHLWAQTRFGSLNIDPSDLHAQYEDFDRALQWLQALEVIRLEARIALDLPGLYRQLTKLKEASGYIDWCNSYPQLRQELQQSGATVENSLKWLKKLYARPIPEPVCYQAKLDLERAWLARELRLERDKARFRDTLRVIAEEIAQGRDDHKPPAAFEMREQDGATEQELPDLEFLYLDQSMAVPEHLTELANSIRLDLTEIPEEYLVPAGPGEYDPSLLGDSSLDPGDVWSGTYHEEGAFFYDEWDFARQHYRKNWCVLREVELSSSTDDFYHQTVHKYRGHIKSLHRTFEVLRGEDKTLRRQTDGENVDLDAFVEAWSDLHTGHEMTNRLFTRMRREERDLAAIFMVDMSGSTKGWINEVEREALILLVEALEILGDRYAIYGFSGWARKRCEVFPIKTFDQQMDDLARATLCAIEAKDYTRMGAPVRHFTHMLNEVEARTKLLVTLSDGKPDDYDHYYGGEYGIEDTRQALFEARVSGIHPFCITIDREGAEYLPHMYGRANYVVLDDVAKLPLKISDIYRKIAT